MGILNRRQFKTPRFSAELYAAITYRARQAIFFQDYQVPDTPQGRFEVLILHLSLVLRRLKLGCEEESAELTQSLCDWVVADMEESLRLLPVSELKLARHFKGFVEGFYGRLVAYDKALEFHDLHMLEQAIRRNVYGIAEMVMDEDVNALATYAFQTWVGLQGTNVREIILMLKGDC